jgi:hemerythrin-like domain-containing protein
MDSVLDVLRAEHQRILEGTDLALAVADRLERGATVPTGTLSALTNFFSYAVHRNHRDKEDSLLFPRLHHRGFAEEAGCVTVLLREHSECATAFSRMVAAAEGHEHGDRQAAAEWIAAARQYVDGLRRHLQREDEVLFPQAERLLTADDCRELATAFAEFDERAKFTGLDEVWEDLERVRRTLTQTQLPRRC